MTMPSSEDKHVPVLLHEVIEFLITEPEGVYFDGTMGEGGHTRAISGSLKSGGRVIAVDCDVHAVNHSAEWNTSEGISVFHANFSEIKSVLEKAGTSHVNGILLDLGLSSRQLDDPLRGFSFRFDSPLDMRMDERTSEDAKLILNSSSESELADIFFYYGEERHSRRLAKIIVEDRKIKRLESTSDLVTLMKTRWHPQHFTKSAARIFQSLRIAVNREMTYLDSTLEDCLDSLLPGGRIVVISYHSLEDRKVKQAFKKRAQSVYTPGESPFFHQDFEPEVKILTKKVVLPTKIELKTNARARSAKLRAAEKI